MSLPPLSTLHRMAHSTATGGIGGRIFGIGVDLAMISRLDGVHRRHGDHFLKKCLSPTEHAATKTMSKERLATFIASRWAVKEALVKASGQRLLFPHISIVREVKKKLSEPGTASTMASAPADPRARVELSGPVAEWFSKNRLRTPQVSLSHDGDYAIAFVCIEHEE